MIQDIQQTIIRFWDSPALTDYEHESFTYADVARYVVTLHACFAEKGIRRGDKIAICGPNCSRWAIVFMAVVSYGAVVVPILQDFNPEQIHNIVDHSESRILIAGDNILKVIDQSQMPGLEVLLPMSNITVSDEARQLTPEQLVFQPEESPEDLMMINYTSGTTGFSKGVMLPYRAFDSNYEFASKEFDRHVKPGSNILSMLPMAHMYGLMFECLYQFLHGTHIWFLMHVPTPQLLLKAFAEIKPRLVIAVPLIIEKAIGKRLMKKLDQSPFTRYMNVPLIGWFIRAYVRKLVIDAFGGKMYECVVGGAPLNKQIENFLRSFNFPLTVGYGATECAPIITFADWHTFKPGSCGRAVINMEVRIDSDDPQNIPGEILARGKNTMLGYYKNKEATEQALDADGWYHTGDLGVLDKHGNLTIRGRKKNMILGPNGQNIYPEEMEDKLNSMLMVSESIVRQRDGKLDALVCPDYQEAKSLNLTDENIKNIMELNRHDFNEMLPVFERIQTVTIHPTEFEKTAKRSIKRYLYT